MSKGGQLAIAVASVLVALGWVLSSTEGTFIYFESVGALLAEQEQHSGENGRDLRVHGFVVEGSIKKNVESSQVWFAIEDKRTAKDEGAANLAGVEAQMSLAPPRTLTVLYEGIDPPDLFADGAEVIVEGRMGPDTFTATKIMAKCPSKYENAPEEPPAQVADIRADG